MASVPITVLLYDGPLLGSFNKAIKALMGLVILCSVQRVCSILHCLCLLGYLD